jgi:hypothetical protein
VGVMSLSMIIFLPVVVAFGFLYWAEQLDEEHGILKLMFQLFFIPLVWIAVNFAVINVRIIYSSDSELVGLLGDFTYYLGWVFFIVGAYIVYNIFIRLKDFIQQRKSEKESEKYD